MRVLHVIDHFGLGGAQTLLKNILDSWEDDIIEVYAYSLRKNKNEINLKNKQRIFRCKTKNIYNIRSLLELKKLIKEKKIDILHCHLGKSIFFGTMIKILFDKKIKLVVHEHGRIFKNQFWYNYILNKSQKVVNLYLANSETTKKKLMENAGISKEKIKVLYNFVDIEKFNPNALKEYNRDIQRRKLGTEKNDFVIGFVGRLVKIKGCTDLIKAVNLLVKKNKKIKLLVAGEGSEKNELVNLTKEFNLEKNVRFLGYVEDIKGFYNCLDVVVIPSHWESFGIVGLEAQAMGVPVIASNVEGLNEIITDKETGMLFKPKNEKDLAEKIKLVCKNIELRKKLIKNGLENVKTYTLNEYITKLNKIYKMV